MDASSANVCIPLSHPNSSASVHAPLKLVGQPDPSLQVAYFAHASTASRSSPRSNWSSRTAADSHDGAPLRADLMEPLKGSAACNSGLLMEAEGPSTQENCSAENFSAGIPSPQSSSTGNFICADNPSPRGCLDGGCCSSLGKDKRVNSIKPFPMKKPCVAGQNVNLGIKKCGKVGSAGGTISVSLTEKEKVVHTDSSNFREVVHQLTGASADDVDLLPVTVPLRAQPNRGNGEDANRYISRQDPLVTCDFTGRSSEFGVHKPAPMKLFERRSSSKTLERISTSCRDLPPLVPSPVTPLASDFERICLPISPINTAVVPAQELNYAQVQCTSTLREHGNAQAHPSYNQPAMYMCPNSSQSQPIANNLYIVGSVPHNLEFVAQEASIEDFAIAEKGFFLHPQRPKNSEPALLSLFPESPRDQ